MASLGYLNKLAPSLGRRHHSVDLRLLLVSQLGHEHPSGVSWRAAQLNREAVAGQSFDGRACAELALRLVPFFFAMPFVRNDGGERVPGEAQERQSAGAAEREAGRMAMTSAGAVAFSRTGDPSTGEFEDAVVLKSFGEVPTLDDLLSAT